MNAPSISTDVVAAEIVRATRKGKAEVVVSFYGKFFVFLQRFSPCLLNWIMKRLWAQRASQKKASFDTEKES